MTSSFHGPSGQFPRKGDSPKATYAAQGLAGKIDTKFLAGRAARLTVPSPRPRALPMGRPRCSLLSHLGDPGGIYRQSRPTQPLAFLPSPWRGRSGPDRGSVPARTPRSNEDPENKASVRRRCVHALVQGDEVDPQCPELLERVDEMAQAAGKPVITVNYHTIHGALHADVLQIPLRSPSRAARSRSAIRPVAFRDSVRFYREYQRDLERGTRNEVCGGRGAVFHPDSGDIGRVARSRGVRPVGWLCGLSGCHRQTPQDNRERKGHVRGTISHFETPGKKI